MLRIAVQSKGRLFDDTMTLLAEADIKLSTSKRTLLTQSSNFPVEVLFLRDDDIPQCVASGVADLGRIRASCNASWTRTESMRKST